MPHCSDCDCRHIELFAQCSPVGETDRMGGALAPVLCSLVTVTSWLHRGKSFPPPPTPEQSEMEAWRGLKNYDSVSYDSFSRLPRTQVET